MVSRRSGRTIWRRMLVCAFLLGAHGNGHAQGSDIAVHIPAKPLADALIEFAFAAHISISDTGIDFGTTSSNAVNGTYSKEVALARLLDGTGFRFELLDAGAIHILPKRAATGPTAPTETVIVTATKREALAQSLPYSIFVIEGSEIDANGIRTPGALAGRVAGMTATNLGPGQDKVFLRGLTDSVLPGLSESMVGLYLDETRIADDAPDPDIRLVDVERTEIMRGPQGSLYGAGSLGGLVRIVTRKPDLDAASIMTSASAATTDGGNLSASIDGVLNVPIIEGTFGLRAVGYYEEAGGYVNDIRLGRSRANEAHTAGGRFALLWQPDGWLTVTASIAVQELRANDSQYIVKGAPGFDRDLYVREPHSDDFLSSSLTAEATLGWANLVTSTGIVNRRLDDIYDASTVWQTLTGYPTGTSPFGVARQIRAYTHETRLVSTSAGRLHWLAGLYLSHRDEDYQSLLRGPDAIGATVTARNENREDRANEGAIFGEIAYDFTDALTATLGGRAFVASKDVSARVQDLTSSGTTRFRGSNSQSGFAPKLVLDYRAAPGLLLYAQYAQGYRLAGVNVDDANGAVNPPTASANVSDFDSDRLTNYEAGAKWNDIALGLTANGALYYVDWRDVQTDQIAPNGAYYTLNAGAVRDFGAEADVSIVLWNDVTLGGNAFWNNAHLGHPNPLLVSTEGSLPGAPNFGAGLTARYDTRLFGEFPAFLSAAYSYVGTSHLGFDETTPAMGGYHLTSLRAGLKAGDWTLTAFANNIFDDRGNTFAFGNPFDSRPQITPPRPRTIGLNISLSQ